MITEKNCKKISGEMMSGEECVFKNSQIEKVDESNYLLKNLPIENINIDINKNGIMKIDYSISEKKIKIDMEYDGGQTFWRDAMKAYKNEVAFVTELENIISIGIKWKFIKNYTYKKGIKNTTGKALSVHQDHFHLGYR
ncbi:hypothetical protein PGH12_10535 [Chryseobacterium wangxinyae]|uniref:hypothetical protein n=1 Tax=Chryseobacterium sp. CY350 TaxID=2997336 RepID=UPI0022710F4A|nr:hypothetical protein [Chryseobacterium sp. CY350]MCY0978706.1 hypothetical protein [Chryseobacterium sp. CY350]WBZ93913.1 hypothetical protein PGH12_10535 [Chryseobacterium sp. CY350]